MTVQELTLPQILDGFADSTELPAYLRISLLEDCNERCFFCHNEGYQGREQVIDENVMWKAIRASAALGKNKFKFTGGEPTSHPSLLDYVRELHTAVPEAQIGLITNATLLGTLAQPLRDVGLDSINVSLHLLDKEAYRKITKLDGLDAALEGLNAADAAGFRDIVINFVVSKVNLDEIPAVELFCRERGYELRVLDILATRPALSRVRVSPEEVTQRFPTIDMKPKLFHQKCGTCAFVPICGEAEYLRLSAGGSLDPCMYRNDLKVPLLSTDSEAIALKKVALGFRRVWYDNL